MAELSTIARPYASGLMKALQERKAGADEVAEVLQALKAICAVAQDPQVATLVGDPKLTDDQLFNLIEDACGGSLPKDAANLLRVVVENDRLEVMPEIARQFHELKNFSEGVADAYIETAFELSDDELKGLLDKLASKFPGVKLTPIVRVNPELIGGVAVTVGDQVIDATVRTRLEQMKTMLTA